MHCRCTPVWVAICVSLSLMLGCARNAPDVSQGAFGQELAQGPAESEKPETAGLPSARMPTGVSFENLTEEHIGKPCVVTATPAESVVNVGSLPPPGMITYEEGRTVYRGKLKAINDESIEEEGLWIAAPFPGTPYEDAHKAAWIPKERILSIQFPNDGG